jgi:hypothetical protein
MNYNILGCCIQKGFFKKGYAEVAALNRLKQNGN